MFEKCAKDIVRLVEEQVQALTFYIFFSGFQRKRMFALDQKIHLTTLFTAKLLASETVSRVVRRINL